MIENTFALPQNRAFLASVIFCLSPHIPIYILYINDCFFHFQTIDFDCQMGKTQFNIPYIDKYSLMCGF